MTGAEIALLVSGLMSGAGALFGGGGGERQSFGADTAHELLDRATKGSDNMMGMLNGLLGQPINVTQAPGAGSLPTFAGGGMPMPIGALGGGPGGGGGNLPGMSTPVRPRMPSGGRGGSAEDDGSQKPGQRPVRMRGRGGPGGPGPGGGGIGHENYRLPGIDQLGMQNQSGWGTALSPEELMTIVHMSGKKGGR